MKKLQTLFKRKTLCNRTWLGSKRFPWQGTAGWGIAEDVFFILCLPKITPGSVLLFYILKFCIALVRVLWVFMYINIHRLFNFQEQSQNCKMFFFHVFTFYRNQCMSKVDIWSNKKLGILFLNKKVSTSTAAMKILCSKGQANIIFIFRHTFNFYCHSG